MAKKPFSVETRDVDGGDVRHYSTFAGAARRFKDMGGYDLLTRNTYQAVSNYGCVVTFESSINIETDKLQLEASSAPVRESCVSDYPRYGGL